MIVVVLLVIALFMLPLTLRLTSRSRRNAEAGRGLRWHGIRWEQANDFDALVERAITKQKSGDTKGALADYDQALSKKRTALVLNNRGCALLESGDLARAIADLHEAVTLDPASATAHCSLAEAYARSGETGPALESLKQAVSLDPAWRTYASTAEGFAALRATPEWAAWVVA